jgi:hypothetical protein
MATDGYDALTAYTWPGLGLQEGERFGPFETLLEGYLSMWGDITRDSPIPLLAPICGGWDSRPWHGEANLVRYERTPELFRKHLQQARDFLESHGAGKKVLDLVLVEAWNEWGEGSYIEPHQEHGFGYLDAIREVFTNAPREHDDLTPMDAGLGPYDVPALSSGRD